MRQLLSAVLVLLGILGAGAAEDAATLARQLRSPDPDQRRAAAKGLIDLGPDARPVVRDLMQALKDKDQFVRRFSAQALGEIGPGARQAVPGLKAALGDSRKEVVTAAANALGKLGPEGIHTLTDVVKDGKLDGETRGAAVAALGNAGPNAKDAVPVLIDVLKGGTRDPKPAKNKKATGPADPNLRVEAALALGDIGPEAQDAVPALEQQATVKGKGPLKAAANEALRKITGRPAKKK
jgi:HEAT repeat protein